MAHVLPNIRLVGELANSAFLLHSAISSLVTLANIFHMSMEKGASYLKCDRAQDHPSHEERSNSSLCGGEVEQKIVPLPSLFPQQ